MNVNSVVAEDNGVISVVASTHTTNNATESETVQAVDDGLNTISKSTVTNDNVSSSNEQLPKVDSSPENPVINWKGVYASEGSYYAEVEMTSII
jgi:hypothetical protein